MTASVKGISTGSKRGGSPSAQQARASETRQLLIDAAATLFGAQGFHATSTPMIVESAGVTRGSLYHHFGSKQDLFEAVFRVSLAEINEQARASVRKLAGDTWAQFTGALHEYLHLLAQRGDLRRIILIDGPPVLGWSRWHTLQAEWVEAGILVTLAQLRQEGKIAPVDPASSAILIQGAVNDAAMAIAHAERPIESSAALGVALTNLLEGLRTT